MKETAFLCIMVWVGEGAVKKENDRFPCIHGLIHLVGLTFTSHVLGLYKPRGSSNEGLLYQYSGICHNAEHPCPSDLTPLSLTTFRQH